VQDTTIVKAASADTEPEQPPYLKHREQKAAQLMRIFLGEADQWEGEPLYDVIVKRLRMMEISGATVHRGILGYGAKGHTHKQSFLHLSRDLPIVISVIDSPEKLEQAASAIEQIMSDGLIVMSGVEVIRVIHAAS
jgi:PII-like signaling protein